MSCPPSDADRGAEHPGAAEELARAKRELAQLGRELRQERRRADRSEALLRQSRASMLRTNQELQAATECAEQALEAKGRFLATMSHELRTPMNGILGALDLLREAGLEPAQLDLAKIVHRSAESLLDLLNDILDFSKIEAGRLELEAVPFSLRKLLGDLMGLQTVVAQRRGLQLELEIDEAVPETVAGDPMRLRQVLLNLLSNALKFTEQGSVRIVVGCSGGDRLSFGVADTGPGMAPDVARRIFDAFTQGDESTTRRFGGTGLGLAITHRLVGLMGGEIRVESRLGAGTLFEFDADLPATCELPRRSGDRAEEQRAAPASLPGYHVLVADDQPVNRLVACRMLEQLGCTTVVAVDGRQALELVQSQDFDAVFMDGSMPVMDGYAATRAIRELPGPVRGIRIIAMTAHAMPGDRERCLDAGMDEYLSKPVRTADLVAMLQRLPQPGGRAA